DSLLTQLADKLFAQFRRFFRPLAAQLFLAGVLAGKGGHPFQDAGHRSNDPMDGWVPIRAGRGGSVEAMTGLESFPAGIAFVIVTGHARTSSRLCIICHNLRTLSV